MFLILEHWDGFIVWPGAAAWRTFQLGTTKNPKYP
jgi:hypothetical protein